MAPHVHLVGWAAEGPVAIHCHLGVEHAKRTKSRMSTLPFDNLSKFDSVVSRSGPWGGTYVMTLADKVDFCGRVKRGERFVTRSDWHGVDMRSLLSESKRFK